MTFLERLQAALAKVEAPTLSQAIALGKKTVQKQAR